MRLRDRVAVVTDSTSRIGRATAKRFVAADWDTALREDNGCVNPLGLYDLERRIRPVGEAYRMSNSTPPAAADACSMPPLGTGG